MPNKRGEEKNTLSQPTLWRKKPNLSAEHESTKRNYSMIKEATERRNCPITGDATERLIDFIVSLNNSSPPSCAKQLSRYCDANDWLVIKLLLRKIHRRGDPIIKETKTRENINNLFAKKPRILIRIMEIWQSFESDQEFFDFIATMQNIAR